jgi:hypothetical protein
VDFVAIGKAKFLIMRFRLRSASQLAVVRKNAMRV